MTEKAEYVGKVLSAVCYTSKRRYYIGRNCDYPEYSKGKPFCLSDFLSKFEGKTVRLTLEVVK